MNLILLRATGRGEGHPGEAAVGEFSIPQISTGDILRAGGADGTELGKEAGPLMDARAAGPRRRW